ncbi:DUF4822 domain-containing protein [Myroides sp. DF42-4-2]|uniref:DUF4822 domain-containing protein n=1 Tax=unclassified Myroides TaxID=2642485 RepID=UPI002575043A|nr:DUF4822 domain-containing protein [Myroides sp. DF42-4-2]MDM1406790.1 DUF4822 domain-containing protein [Myroides sp. DF42-4-2]
MRLKFLTALAVLLASSFFLQSCSKEDNNRPQSIQDSKTTLLATHVWKTTAIRDHQGKKLDLASGPVQTYTGYAYYRRDGTFRFVDFNDKPKLFGTWKLTDGASKRHLTVYNNENSTAYTRTVDLLAVNNSLFSYRIVPDPSKPNTFYEVDHQPVTNHPEPLTPAQLLAAVPWKTVAVLDITAGVQQAKKLNMNTAPAADYVGNTYYTNVHGNAYFPKNKEGKYANGTFAFTALNDKKNVRSKGDWYVSVDGTQRTLIGRNPNQSIAWEQKVYIVELTTAKFTYDIQVGKKMLRVFHQPLTN